MLYNNKNYIFSISIKVLYLFLFLSCFFYIIVQKQVTDHLSDNLSDILYENYKKNQIEKDQYNLLLSYYNSSPNDKLEHEDKTIRYNNLLYILNICFIIFFLIIPMVIYYVSKFIFNKDIPIGQILIFNIILYILVGIIEYTFFTQIASKYVPVTDGEILNIIKNYFLK
jgi:hypothetical protein